MSIMTRIEDADLLFQLGRKEGALLLVLIAVAATSKKRYPKSGFETIPLEYWATGIEEIISHPVK
jgi:hypothetical protein